MDTSRAVHTYLQQAGMEFSAVPVPAATSKHTITGNIIKSVLLEDETGRKLMAVIPAGSCIDRNVLENQLHRRLSIVSPEHGDDAGTPAPLPALFHMTCVVDEAVGEFDAIGFACGGRLFTMATDAYFELLGDALHGMRFSCPIVQPDRAVQDGRAETKPRTEFRQRLSSLTELPTLPEIAHRLLRLRNKPEADTRDLARVIELDASLSAQIMRYARSPLYGYRGKVDTVQEAIARVLGYTMTMNIALGLATGSTFQLPRQGVLGMNALWRHSVYTAALAHALARHMPRQRQPAPGLAYLAGLLHNMGYFLLGHVFPAEYHKLSAAIAGNPQVDISVIENTLLGAHHGELGAWLLRAWHLPEAVVVTQLQHHNPDYAGPYSACPLLVLLANRLLKRYGIGDASSDRMPPQVISALGLDERGAVEVLDNVMEAAGDIEFMARHLAA